MKVRNTSDPSGFYALLEVEPWASDKEIRESYRRLSKKFHPDGHSPDREKFEEVKNAYKVLSTERESYNKLPEGTRLREKGTSLRGDFVPVELEEESRSESVFSYRYDYGGDSELSQRWYESLVPKLIEWGYRRSVCLHLSNRLKVSGRTFEVPYEEPTGPAIFLLCLEAMRFSRDS